MKKIVSVTLSGIASFILLICLLFTAVQFVMHDTAFFETQFKKLELDKSMGIALGNLATSIERLTDYMEGTVPDIYVEVSINGELKEMFDLPIEKIHMEEVRELWLSLKTLRNAAAVIAMLLAVIAALIHWKEWYGVWAEGMLVAILLTLVIAGFVGSWVAIDFEGMWTAFHHIIFPGNENWLLPSNSHMIQMLPGELFASFIGRFAFMAGLVIALLALLSLIVLSWRKKHRAKLLAEQEKKEAEVKAEPEQVIVENGPDLITVHKLQNMPVRQRMEYAEKLKRTAEIKHDVESFGESQEVEESYTLKDGRFKALSPEEMQLRRDEGDAPDKAEPSDPELGDDYDE